MAATDVFLCTALQQSELRDGALVTEPFRADHFPFLAAMTVDGATGRVQMTGLAEMPWRVLAAEPDGDLVVMGPHPGDGIWIRQGRSPISFLMLFSTVHVITGTCEILDRERLPPHG